MPDLRTFTEPFICSLCTFDWSDRLFDVAEGILGIVICSWILEDYLTLLSGRPSIADRYCRP